MNSDDSPLFHNGVYDPAKAREYYLKTRHLKGRQKGSQDDSHPGGGRAGGSPVAVKTGTSRQEELAAQRAALEKRLDRLREILRQLVEKAKGRAGVKSTKKSDTPAGKTSGGDSKSKPLTESQKREKAAKARAAYKKENHNTSDSAEIEALKRQIADIRAKIKQAIEDARKLSSQHHSQTAPKGR